MLFITAAKSSPSEKGTKMVVKHSKSLENIYDSLERLLEFFASQSAENTDDRTLSMIEHDLVGMESRLRLFTDYRPSRK